MSINDKFLKIGNRAVVAAIGLTLAGASQIDKAAAAGKYDKAGTFATGIENAEPFFIPQNVFLGGITSASGGTTNPLLELHDSPPALIGTYPAMAATVAIMLLLGLIAYKMIRKARVTTVPHRPTKHKYSMPGESFRNRGNLESGRLARFR